MTEAERKLHRQKLVEEGEIDATTGLSAKIDASDIHRRFVKRVEDIPTCPRCGVMPAYKHTHHNSLFKCYIFLQDLPSTPPPRGKTTHLLLVHFLDTSNELDTDHC